MHRACVGTMAYYYGMEDACKLGMEWREHQPTLPDRLDTHASTKLATLKKSIVVEKAERKLASGEMDKIGVMRITGVDKEFLAMIDT